jgi:hypothetical protein
MRVLAVVLFAAIAIGAQSPQTGVRFTATTQNVSGAGETIKIALTDWSTDAQKDEMIAAWTLTASATQGRGGRGGAGRGAAAGRGGGGGARGARGAATPATDIPPDPDAVDPDTPAPPAGRGGGRGAGTAAPAVTPEASLAAALKRATTLGTLWTSETVGYSIKYAYRDKQQDGGERVILATDRRVGAWSALWKPSGTVSATDYAFSVIELHLNAAGDGEGRGVVVGKIAVDVPNKTIALEGYNALPIILKGVKRK